MIMFIVFCVAVGAALGSFACCQAWRIRYRAEGKKELGERSVCLRCGKKLRWYENIPIVSWVVQRGKCRKCGEKIGGAEIISEVLGAVFGGLIGIKYLDKFIRVVFKDGMNILGGSSGGTTSEMWLVLAEILLIVVIFTTMGIIAIYDAKWGEMPTKLLWATVILGVIFAGIRVWRGEVSVLELGGAIGILAGIYYILYKVSEEKWVGGGDWILCLAIGLILGEPFLALLELSLANILGLIIMVPIRRGKDRKRREIPMGPFLVIAAILIFSFSDLLMNMI